MARREDAHRGDGWLIAVATLMANAPELIVYAHSDEAILRWAAFTADRIDCERRTRNAKDHAIGLREEEDDA